MENLGRCKDPQRASVEVITAIQVKIRVPSTHPHTLRITKRHTPSQS